VAWRQPFHPFLELSVDPVGLGQTWPIGAWSVGLRVVELWHDAISGTFGDDAIVTGDISRHGESATVGDSRTDFLAPGVNLMGEHGVTSATVRMTPEARVTVALLHRRG
jgi:hypothetical protein